MNTIEPNAPETNALEILRPFRLFMIAGEASGDQLGAALLRELQHLTRGNLSVRGVGGRAMAEQGLKSLFPLEDIAVMGLLPILKRLPLLLRRMRETERSVLADPPDLLLLIDSPEFTHRIARKLRPFLPNMLIVQYVSPSVWAWRSGRAQKMRQFIDHVLALFPFEPEHYRRLLGPNCSYVGHPLLEQRPPVNDSYSPPNLTHRNRLLILPGSRSSEIERLLPIFGQTLTHLRGCDSYELQLITLPHLREQIQNIIKKYSYFDRLTLNITTTESEKIKGFSKACAALAASGTITLELALANIPTLVAYKVSPLEAQITRFFVNISYMSLPNILLNEACLPEFFQKDCTAPRLGQCLDQLLHNPQVQAKQRAGTKKLTHLMRLTDNQRPSRYAAQTILNLWQTKIKKLGLCGGS